MTERSTGGWTVREDPARGGRVDVLRDPAGRDWLWRHPDRETRDARERVRPGDPFVDAGGWEECFPTIAGASDHGEVWDRPWRAIGDGGGDGAAGRDSDGFGVAGDGFRLERRFAADGAALVAWYRLEAAPGFRFVWAAHLLLDLSADARLEAAPGTPCRCWPDHWRGLASAAEVEGPWPAPLGFPLDRLEQDGSALFFMLLSPGPLAVADGRRLTLHLRVPGQPAAVAVWRNLGGWPPTSPYRSIGIEPAIGRHYDRDLALPRDLGVVGPTGVLEWTLTLTADGPEGWWRA